MPELLNTKPYSSSIKLKRIKGDTSETDSRHGYNNIYTYIDKHYMYHLFIFELKKSAFAQDKVHFGQFTPFMNFNSLFMYQKYWQLESIEIFMDSDQGFRCSAPYQEQKDRIHLDAASKSGRGLLKVTCR